MSVCTALGSGGVGIPESAQRISRRQRHNAVAEHADGVDAVRVQWSGHPINHSTNRGLKLRRPGEHGAPSGDVPGAGWEERQAESVAACPLISGSSARAPERAIRPPVTSATEGVAQFAAIAGSGVPPAPNAWFGPPFSPSHARGVGHTPGVEREHEEPLALMRRANVRRAEESRLNREAKAA